MNNKIVKAFKFFLFGKWWNIRALKYHIYAFKPSILYINKHSRVSVKKNFIFNEQWDMHRTAQNTLHGSLYVEDGAGLEVRDSFICYAGCRITINKGASLVLKGNGYLMHESVINCFDHIEIGERCAIAERVVIRDSHSHSIEGENFRVNEPITIGDHVWIGMGAIICPGVTIENDSVVAAGAVVVDDVPAHVLVGGVPAKIIKRNITWK